MNMPKFDLAFHSRFQMSLHLDKSRSRDSSRLKYVGAIFAGEAWNAFNGGAPHCAGRVSPMRAWRPYSCQQHTDYLDETIGQKNVRPFEEIEIAEYEHELNDAQDDWEDEVRHCDPE